MSSADIRKSRGRPAIGRGQPLMVRLRPELAAAVDAWRAAQADKPGRAEALRRLAELGLKAEAGWGL